MIKLIKSSFYHEKETKEKLAEFILNTDIFSMSQQCKAYEGKFAKKQGRKYAIFVSSGSMANLILIQSLLNLSRLKKDDSIGFSTLTWSTNVMPILQLGLQAVPFDCELSNLNLSSDILKNDPQSANIKALFITNVLGFSADIDKIKEFCSQKNIILIEDNCESLGSSVNGKLLGNFGIASTFSNFVGHHISTIEGGFICTDDEELYNMTIMVRAHGWDRNLDESMQKKLRSQSNTDDFFARYTFYDLAFNGRPTEINGFIGNIQINYWDEMVAIRQKNFLRFNEALNANSDFYHYDFSHMDIISNFAMPIIAKSHEKFLYYKSLFEKEEVEIRPVIAGDVSKQPFFRKYVKDVRKYENSSLIHENGFYFGNNPEMTDAEVDTLCNLLRNNG